MTTINCDMGESLGLYKIGDDAGLMPFIDIANVACGFHASDYNHMGATCQLAKAHGVRVGAHPSLPDLQGFGRREMKMGREELADCLIYQIGAPTGFLEAAQRGHRPDRGDEVVHRSADRRRRQNRQVRARQRRAGDGRAVAHQAGVNGFLAAPDRQSRCVSLG
jgi:hypothetical protein